MAIDADTLKGLIERELAQVSDARVIGHIRSLLVEPTVALYGWDYGEPGEQYPCWIVLAERGSSLGIAYCESGFGPRSPWGLVWLESETEPSMGMDSGWFRTFLEAYFESAASDLPIWRVFKTGASGIREAISGESSWDATWEQVNERREADPTSRYDCDHSIARSLGPPAPQRGNLGVGESN